MLVSPGDLKVNLFPYPLRKLEARSLLQLNNRTLH